MAIVENNLVNFGGLEFGGLHLEMNFGRKEVRKQTEDLSIPLRGLTTSPTILACLSWHSRSSHFVGRANELETLLQWALQDAPVSLKFVHGGGGVGKSRLAAELALCLRRRKWNAGFFELERAEFPSASTETDTLIVIDYPEESPHELKMFLERLRRIEARKRLRILCLSRELPLGWGELVRSARLVDMFDARSLVLGGVDEAAGYDLFASALEKISEAVQTTPPPVSEALFHRWFASSHVHATPLYLIAAAAHSAFSPTELVLDLAGEDVARALVEKEHDRLKRLAESHTLPKQALIEFVAAAVLQDGVRTVDQVSLASVLPAAFSLDPSSDILEAVSQIDDEGIIRFEMPDVLAACFVAVALEASAAPGDLVWKAMTMRPAPLARFSRLARDAQMVLGLQGGRLIEAAISNLSDSSRYSTYLRSIGLQSASTIDPILWPLWGAIHRYIADTSDDPAMVAGSLNNAALIMSNQGRHSEALICLERGRANLAKAGMARGEKYREMAANLLNTGRAYASVGTPERAIKTLRECIAYTERAIKAVDGSFASSIYWEVRETAALAHDNIARSLFLLGRNSEAVSSSEAACEMSDTSRMLRPRPYGMVESGYRLSLAISCFLDGQVERARRTLEEDEEQLRRNVAGERIGYPLCVNLRHQVEFGFSACDKLQESFLHNLLGKAQEAEIWADRLLAASPANMVKLAVDIRGASARLLHCLGDLDGWLTKMGEIVRLLWKHRSDVEAVDDIILAAAIRSRQEWGDDQGLIHFLAAFPDTEATRAAWEEAPSWSADDPRLARAVQLQIWPEDVNNPSFRTL